METCESGNQRCCNSFPIFGGPYSRSTFLSGWFWKIGEEESGKWARNRPFFGSNITWNSRYGESFFQLDVLTEIILRAIHFAIFFLVGWSMKSHPVFFFPMGNGGEIGGIFWMYPLGITTFSHWKKAFSDHFPAIFRNGGGGKNNSISHRKLFQILPPNFPTYFHVVARIPKLCPSPLHFLT